MSHSPGKGRKVGTAILKANLAASDDAAITLFLVLEHRVLREALTRALSRQAGINVASSGSLDLEAIAVSNCDVLLTDRPTVKGLPPDFVSAVKRAIPHAKVILSGMQNDFDTFLHAISSGVSGYLLQDASTAETIAAIRMAARGGAVCPPHLCLELFQHIAQGALHSSQVPNRRLCTRLGLTLRQQQLITLLSKGMTNKEIASGLNLSEFTVRNHVHRIMRQLHAGSRHEAVQVACEGN